MIAIFFTFYTSNFKSVTEEEKPKESSKLNNLKDKLAEKDKKLSNQSNELNYLTNNIIPKLKKENATIIIFFLLF